MLVEVLASRQPGGDYAQASRLVREQRVQVNGNVALDPAKVLKAGDVVKVLAHAATPAASVGDVRLVHVDEHLVVVQKPPGVTTMREGGSTGRRNRQATLDDMIARLLVERESRGRAGRKLVYPVHRLDRNTSGLMVFARTPSAEFALTGLFQSRDVERCYLAVVHGHPESLTISSHIVRDRGDGLRGSAEAWGRDPAAGQRAVTHIEPVEAIGPYALIRCTLETGRTHQIRIHLSEIGHMLCGEKEYVRQPDSRRVRDNSGAPRHALHAAYLSFSHPVSGRQMSFDSRLPADLVKWLGRLPRR